MPIVNPSPAPGGGLALTGWTEDTSDPANVSSNGGNLILGDGNAFGDTEVADLNAATLTVFNITGKDDPGEPLINGNGQVILNVVLGETISYVSVGTADPTTYTTPIVVNTTAITGGSFAWDGAAYQRISAALT